MAVSSGKLERFYLLTQVCEASLADITQVEVDPLLFGVSIRPRANEP